MPSPSQLGPLLGQKEASGTLLGQICRRVRKVSSRYSAYSSEASGESQVMGSCCGHPKTAERREPNTCGCWLISTRNQRSLPLTFMGCTSRDMGLAFTRNERHV